MMLIWIVVPVVFMSLIGNGTGLRHVRVSVPPAVLRGDSALLLCLFDLEGDSLYSVKWYKGRREFYRFTPKEDPAMKIFPIHGLQVEESRSNATHLTLKHVQLSVSGKYSCEVSADSPSFHTALVTGELEVVEIPNEAPQITGIRPKYKVNDIVEGNCSSSWSKPATKLSWFINNAPGPPSINISYPPIREPGGGERERSILGLNLHVKQEHFAGGRLKIRCSASIHDIYWKSTEKSIEEDKPKGIYKVYYLHTNRPPIERHHFQEEESEELHENESLPSITNGCRVWPQTFNLSILQSYILPVLVCVVLVLR